MEPRWILSFVTAGFGNVRIVVSGKQRPTYKSVTGKAEPNEVLFTQEMLRIPSLHSVVLSVVKHKDQLNENMFRLPLIVAHHSVLSTARRFRELGNLHTCVVGKGSLIVYLYFFLEINRNFLSANCIWHEINEIWTDS